MLFNLISLHINHRQLNIVTCRHILSIHLIQSDKKFTITDNHSSRCDSRLFLFQVIEINISNLCHRRRIKYPHYTKTLQADIRFLLTCLHNVASSSTGRNRQCSLLYPRAITINFVTCNLRFRVAHIVREGIDTP